MERGEIWWIDFEPSVGSESSNVRPAVIVSNSAVVRVAERLGRGVVTVVPMTSNTARMYPFQVFAAADVTGLGRDSKLQTEQVRALDVRRFESYAGTLPPEVMEAVDNALRIHLSL